MKLTKKSFFKIKNTDFAYNCLHNWRIILIYKKYNLKK